MAIGSGDDALGTRTTLTVTARLVVGILSGWLAGSGLWQLTRQTGAASVEASGTQASWAEAKQMYGFEQ